MAPTRRAEHAGAMRSAWNRALLVAGSALVLFGPWPDGAARADDLDDAFTRPPEAAKPGVLWMWMGSNVTKEGITRDLEALRQAGFGRATLFSLADTCTPWAGRIGRSPTPEIVAWTEPWWAMVRHAAEEARRLGLELGMHNCPGYTASGGPWIDPEHSMRQLCWSETRLAGGTRSVAELPRPEVDPRAVMPFPVCDPESGEPVKPAVAARCGGYRDIAVVAVPAEGIAAPSGVIDLSGSVQPCGRLAWDAPAGEWIVYRFGHVPLGSLVQPAAWEAAGLECDKASRAAVARHIGHVVSEIQRHLGGLAGTVFTHVHFDSYEAGKPTWTPAMREEFAARRGYDPLPFLPVMAGRTVGGSGQTERFHADFAATMADLHRDACFAAIAEALHAAGLGFSCEPYGGPWRLDDAVAHVDRVMTEFWTDGGVFRPYKLEATVAAARRAGRNIVEAEAFTGRPADSRWTETPAWLKPIGDAAFCAGVNRLVLHRFVHQPWDERIRPGNTMGQWGTHFDRTQTWWGGFGATVGYWSRCQALLQWGRVAEAAGAFSTEVLAGAPVVKAAHRNADGRDVFFVANLAREGGVARCVFAGEGRQPELWDPVGGGRRPLEDFGFEGGRTVVPLEFAPAQSFFVVFREAPTRPGGTGWNRASCEVAQAVEGPWSVDFDPRWGGPEGAVAFDRLEDWTGRPEPGIRFYSGTAVYRTSFDMAGGAAAAEEAWWLDLGEVRHVARVRLNGRDLGVLWCSPWRVDLPPGSVREAGNLLEIEVTNVWANRLIGDEQEPADCVWAAGHGGSGGPLAEFPGWFLRGEPRPSRGRVAFTTWNYFDAASPLVPSGLLGPVTVLRRRAPAGP
jgi:hypothetical protein